MKYPVLGEFKLQRAGSMPLIVNQGDGRLDDISEDWLERMQDAEESRELVVKRSKTRVKPDNWEY